MFRSRGENLRSVFILLFLNIAFYLLEHEDPEKYARLFRFDWTAVLQGEVWRVATWQFTQAGTGWLEAFSLFITLLLLYMMGAALEEEWGTSHFLMLFVLSTLGSAGVAAWLGIPLLGTYFVYYTLLFVYAAAFPKQTLYLFGAIPVRVRLIALVSFGALLYGVIAGGAANIAAMTGSMLGLGYYLSQRVRVAAPVLADEPIDDAELEPARVDSLALQNGARFAAIKHALHLGTAGDLERLLAQCERDALAGVNICPPADYKPDDNDGYCIRCDGFAECSSRFLRSRLTAVAAAAASTASAPAPAAEPASLG
jgi:membrane associated rhomboid family serine protease